MAYFDRPRNVIAPGDTRRQSFGGQSPSRGDLGSRVLPSQANPRATEALQAAQPRPFFGGFSGRGTPGPTAFSRMGRFGTMPEAAQYSNSAATMPEPNYGRSPLGGVETLPVGEPGQFADVVESILRPRRFAGLPERGFYERPELYRRLAGGMTRGV